MFRHPALRPLSRRHQGVLLFARDLKYHLKALREGRESPHPYVLPSFLAFWPSLEAHFRAEETVLVPAILDAAPNGHNAIDRLHRDHARVRVLVAELTPADYEPDSSLADPHACALAGVTAADQHPELDRSDPARLDQLEELRALLHDHTRDEERVLYPFAESVLGPEHLASIERALDQYVV